jgi:hypothetical protein
MGRKSSYFRHSFNAHRDPKVMALMDRKNGVALYGFYFILIEIYGASYVDDDSKNLYQKIRIRHIANVTGVRTDRAQSWLRVCAELELIDTLSGNFDSTLCQLAIPNFLKYYGSYKKSKGVKCPNKKKIKENKRKENKNIIKKNKNTVLFDFDAVYKNYPNKQGKQKGFEYCARHIKTEDDYNALKKSVDNYALVVKGKSKNYIKHFSTFMNCWKDYININLDDFDDKSTAQRIQDNLLSMENKYAHKDF